MVSHISSHNQECVIPVQLVISAVFVYKIIQKTPHVPGSFLKWGNSRRLLSECAIDKGFYTCEWLCSRNHCLLAGFFDDRKRRRSPRYIRLEASLEILFNMCGIFTGTKACIEFCAIQPDIFCDFGNFCRIKLVV